MSLNMANLCKYHNDANVLPNENECPSMRIHNFLSLYYKDAGTAPLGWLSVGTHKAIINAHTCFKITYASLAHHQQYTNYLQMGSLFTCCRVCIWQSKPVYYVVRSFITFQSIAVTDPLNTLISRLMF